MQGVKIQWIENQTEDVLKEKTAVHVVVLCLLCGLTFLLEPDPQQLCCPGSPKCDDSGPSAVPACAQTAAYNASEDFPAAFKRHKSRKINIYLRKRKLGLSGDPIAPSLG
ncbi:hypothetical protein GN956_G291 [Arapaima gigas]